MLKLEDFGGGLLLGATGGGVLGALLEVNANDGAASSGDFESGGMPCMAVANTLWMTL